MTAVMITSPLELIRTRTQAVFHPQKGSAEALTRSHTARMWNSLSLAAADLTALGRVQLLWRGKAFIEILGSASVSMHSG